MILDYIDILYCSMTYCNITSGLLLLRLEHHRVDDAAPEHDADLRQEHLPAAAPKEYNHKQTTDSRRPESRGLEILLVLIYF